MRSPLSDPTVILAQTMTWRPASATFLLLLLAPTLQAEEPKIGTREVRTWITEFERLEEKTRSLLPELENRTARNRLLRQVKTWQKERVQAVEAAFDEKKFPNPGPKKIIRGPYIGYRRVASRFSRTEKRFRPLLQRVQTLAEKLGGIQKQQERLRTLDQLTLRIEAGRRALESDGRPVPQFQQSELTLIRLLLELETDLRTACTAGRELAEPERTLVFVAYGLRIERENTRIQTGMDPDAFASLRDLGHFRMALGFLPLQVEPTLTRSIEGHLHEMRELRYFGHFSPRPERRTVGQRTTLAGWKGSSGENLSSSIPEDAIRAWRWDGGHCRLMISPRWTHAGMGWKDSTGLNVGYGVSPILPRIAYFPEP